MIIVLDNAESILGLPETSAAAIHTIVDELSQFSNICLAITSRISNTLPTHFEIIEIPTLSMEAGHETFYRIYRLGERSDQISEILKELDFHPLSITLLATVAQQNKWNAKRLTAAWEKQRTGVLRTRNLGSLAATVELSLASPMFQELGPDAREVLEVVAFFPQGVNEDNADKLLPTISDGLDMFDTFCNLSLTHRGDGFITMLAPLRDHLRPKDPMASPLLRMAREHYFERLTIELSPSKPGFDKSKWIMSEDVNVEHLLDVFTSIDAESGDVWDACNYFMDHLYWHKPRPVVFGSKIEALPDSKPFKPGCSYFLSKLFHRVGNLAGEKRILIHTLGLWREEVDDFKVADTLVALAQANRGMRLYEEGIQQAREASEIFERLGKADGQAHSFNILASLLRQDGQLDAAEEAASRAIDLSENQLHLCQSHGHLGDIHRSRGNTEKAISHCETALQFASSLGLGYMLSGAHLSLARVYFMQFKLNAAHAHVEHAKSYVGNDMLQLGQVLMVGACVLHMQLRVEEAKLEVSHALAIFEKLGAAEAVDARKFLDAFNRETRRDGLDGDGRLSELSIVSCSLTLLIQAWTTPSPNECNLFFRVSFRKSTQPVPVRPVARPQPRDRCVRTANASSRRSPKSLRPHPLLFPLPQSPRSSRIAQNVGLLYPRINASQFFFRIVRLCFCSMSRWLDLVQYENMTHVAFMFPFL